ncbi:hypothetical protein TI39_contig379g00002 [Zymoseptoria brevis]|uniref:Uncharacterized protein n=1 Tax=Zymoseptoria brevis TaxID=1047168 RepID=A0A0F4GS23_9PEZI|nr:hypothetical protein TI39_contig379g00002 [Zymoseptoria brevis]
MRLRGLLLIAPALVLAADLKGPVDPADGTAVLTNEEILALNHPPAAGQRGTSDDALSTKSKPYKGTEDAPVDGMDGKPHAGPFVDTTPDDPKEKKSKGDAKKPAKPAALEKFGDEKIPEKNDGVMNDENRPIPKKGTTGTEGGITEKGKAKKEAEVKPQSPKEAPADDDAHEWVAGKAKKSTEKDARDTTTGEKTSSYGEAGHGMEKPKDLPEKPHNIPHPDPKIASSGASDSTSDDLSPPIKPASGRDSWLVDTMPDTEGQTSGKPGTKTDPKMSTSNPSTPQAPATNYLPDQNQDWTEWFHSFFLSFTMIIFSEIGDKTFLVAALMAMRHSRLLVFSAALTALIAMTVLSAVLGHAFPSLLPKRLTTFAAAILFLVFGAKSLKEGLAMDPDEGLGEEMREVEQELEEKEHSMRHSRSTNNHKSDAYTLESARSTLSPPLSRSPSPSGDRTKSRGGAAGLTNLLSLVLSPAWVQTFIMTFLGEWGDRSQIATIAMAAGQDYWLVTLGAIWGHACCTGLAVVGGRALAGRVSLRVVTIGGAVAFLAFGLIYLYECLVQQ